MTQPDGVDTPADGAGCEVHREKAASFGMHEASRVEAPKAGPWCVEAGGAAWLHVAWKPGVCGAGVKPTALVGRGTGDRTFLGSRRRVTVWLLLICHLKTLRLREASAADGGAGGQG